MPFKIASFVEKWYVLFVQKSVAIADFAKKVDKSTFFDKSAHKKLKYIIKMKNIGGKRLT